MAHHLGRVGHLRQQLGRHEGADLDLAQAGGVQRVDPAPSCAAVAMVRATLCRPSRGPTSLMCTLSWGIVATAGDLWR